MVKGREKRNKMVRREIRGLKTRFGRKCNISREGPDCMVEAYMQEESEEGVTVLQQGGTAPRVRAAKSSEFGEGKL